jgi:hypothetical protein
VRLVTQPLEIEQRVRWRGQLDQWEMKHLARRV